MNEEDYEISSDGSRQSAADEQSLVSETESTSMQRRNLSAYNIMSPADADSRAGHLSKRARTKSPEPDPVPIHKKLKVVDIQQHAPRAGSRMRRNEFEPIQSSDIANISQEIPPPLRQPGELNTDDDEQNESESDAEMSGAAINEGNGNNDRNGQ
jgi:hypothetical protein